MSNYLVVADKITIAALFHGLPDGYRIQGLEITEEQKSSINESCRQVQGSYLDQPCKDKLSDGYNLATLKLRKPAALVGVSDCEFEENNTEEALEKFKERLENIKGGARLNVDFWAQTLEYYLQNVPSLSHLDNENATPITYCDHARCVAAVARCKYLSDGENPILLVCDFSGVQDFVYTIVPTKALKTLRGRSVFLQLLTEAAIIRICEAFHMPRSLVLSFGGALFVMLLPSLVQRDGQRGEGENWVRAGEILEKIEKNINEHFFKTFNGRLFLAMGWGRCNFDENLRNTWMNVSEMVKQKKGSRFLEFLDANEFVKAPASVECKVCSIPNFEHTKGSSDSEWICDSCEFIQSLGEKMGKESGKVNRFGFSLSNKPADGEYMMLPGDDGEMPGILLNLEGKGDYLLTINREEPPGLEDAKHSSYLFNINISDWVSPGSTEELAEESEGIKKICTLRMDLDDLGMMHYECMDRDRYGLEGMTALNRSLNYFFGKKFDELCKDKSLNVVYAGGDDCLVVGSWNQVFDFAFDVHGSLHEYFGSSEKPTISAGLYISAPDFPFYFLARYAGDVLEMAKSNRNNCRKNSYAIFATQVDSLKKKRLKVFCWDEAVKVKNCIYGTGSGTGGLKDKLTKAIATNGRELLVSSSLLHTMINLIEEANEEEVFNGYSLKVDLLWELIKRKNDSRAMNGITALKGLVTGNCTGGSVDEERLKFIWLPLIFIMYCTRSPK